MEVEISNTYKSQADERTAVDELAREKASKPKAATTEENIVR